MNIKAVAGDITKMNVDAIIVNLFEGVTAPGGATGAVDKAMDGAISKLISEGEIKGKSGEITNLHTLGKIVPTRVLVAGLGKQQDFDQDSVRQVSAGICRYLRKLGVSKAATVAHGAGIGGMDPGASSAAIAEGAILGLYEFDRYMSKKKNNKDLEELQIVEIDASKLDAMIRGINTSQIMAEATNLCRDMVNEPANYMTPTKMAEIARQVANEVGLEIEILDRPQMEELGMGALLGVAKGSDQPPKMIILRYWGDRANEANNLGLLGKGITFDTGGISLKPAQGMGEMKTDMAGGASVIGAIKAIAQLKPKINITAMVPATENMPGGSAQRPGDVVRAMSGKSIEVDNTDAEGRLALADALSYARIKLNLTRLVDVATLTGAMVIALGHTYTGAFSNNQDMVNSVIEAGKKAGELIWQFPLHNDYKEQNKSDVADVKNTGGRPAGSITAAHFLAEFSEDTPWVHLDIAGTARAEKDKGYIPKGASGIPVRTLVNLALDLGIL